MPRIVLASLTSAFLCLCAAAIAAGPEAAADAARAGGGVIPTPPLPDASGIKKNRFISFSNLEAGFTAIRVTLVSLHHVDPPYGGDLTIPFTQFEGQSLFAGPPTRYVESLSSGVPFYASTLQCTPYYHDWSTLGLLHVTGEAVVPSSIYDVQILAESCRNDEDNCEDVSAFLTVETSRWGDIMALSGEAPSGGLPDFADITALIDKFKDVPGAPSKPVVLLAGLGERGLIDPSPDLSFLHVAEDVGAFKGRAYPYKPGRCSNLSVRGCITDEDCTGDGDLPAGACELCGVLSGGACCHADATCDILPAGACNLPGDMYHGEEAPCSRCCGPRPGCKELTNAEWVEVQLLWPGLDRRDVCREAEADPAYNCVSWVMDNIHDWIWDEVDQNQDWLFEISDFEAFFAQFQKSAILYGSEANVLHTAKPLPNNCASSKAGEWIRMRHDRYQIEGGYYGDVLATHEY